MNGSFVKTYEALCDFLPQENKDRQVGFPPLTTETEEKLKKITKLWIFKNTLEQPMHQRRNQKGNQKIPGDRLK